MPNLLSTEEQADQLEDYLADQSLAVAPWVGSLMLRVAVIAEVVDPHHVVTNQH